VRIEIGPRDLEAGNVIVSQRLGLDEKQTIAIADLAADMPARLTAYHDFLLKRATDFREDHTVQVDDLRDIRRWREDRLRDGLPLWPVGVRGPHQDRDVGYATLHSTRRARRCRHVREV